MSARKCLVLMPFAESFYEVYDLVFRPACHAQGLECWRVDELATPGSITTDIVHGIMDADLIIADLTAQNPNVFYELGIAHAFSKHVITVCQSTEDVPFDVRSYRVLAYSQSLSGAARLRGELERAIKDVLSADRSPGNPVLDALALRNRQQARSVGPDAGHAGSASPFAAQIREALIEKAVGKITSALKRIASTTSKYESVIISAPGRKNVYVQFLADKKGKSMIGEAVGNHYLGKREQLSPGQLKHLKELGWNPPDEGGNALNFSRDWVMEDDHDLRVMALEAARALSEVYNVTELDAVDVELV